MGHSKTGKRKVVISGSFRKFFEEIKKIIELFETHGWEVLSPSKSRIINPGDEFPILESDRGSSELEIESKHLAAISNADLLFIVNPEGYIGNSTALEIGWARSLALPIYSLEIPAEKLFRNLCLTVSSIEKVFDEIEANEIKLCRESSIPKLQRYIAQMVVKRGFGEETPKDILILMIEEIGELAKFVRKESGLKFDAADVKQHEISLELADILIYLLDISNSYKVDLISALMEKEKKNEKRVWISNQ